MSVPILRRHPSRPETRPGRRIPVLLCAFALAAASAWAAPDDDFKAGELAYRRGDMSGAMIALRKAADQGHVRAQTLFAYILDQADFNEEAATYYRRAAGTGDAEGEFGLAGLYALGEGVPRDPGQAVALYQRAAAKGHGGAVAALAQAYISGNLELTPERRDNANAAEIIRQAANLGYDPAAVALARAYRTGDFGIVPDAAEAAKWEAKVKAKASPKPASVQRKP